MATETSRRHPSGAAAEAKDKGEELVSATQQQITAKALELGGEADLQIREQLDQRSNQAGEQLQSIGKTLQSGAEQLRLDAFAVPPCHVFEQDRPEVFEAGRRCLKRGEDRFALIDREAKDSRSIEQGRIQATRKLRRDNSSELPEKPLIDSDAADQQPVPPNRSIEVVAQYRERKTRTLPGRRVAPCLARA